MTTVHDAKEEAVLTKEAFLIIRHTFAPPSLLSSMRRASGWRR